MILENAGLGDEVEKLWFRRWGWKTLVLTMRLENIGLGDDDVSRFITLNYPSNYVQQCSSEHAAEYLAWSRAQTHESYLIWSFGINLFLLRNHCSCSSTFLTLFSGPYVPLFKSTRSDMALQYPGCQPFPVTAGPLIFGIPLYFFSILLRLEIV